MNFKKLLLSGFIAFFGSVTYGQVITNVKSAYTEGKVQITYDIDFSSSKEKYKISLTFKDAGGKNITPTSLEGDFNWVAGGKNKQIIWDISKDAIELTADIKPVVAIEETYKLLGGPKNALLSLVVPGLGGQYVYKKRGWAYFTTTATVGLLGWGVLETVISNNRYDEYLDAQVQPEIDNSYEKANSAHHRKYVAFSLAGGLWLTDIILTAIKGARNEKENEPFLNARTFSYGYYYEPQVHAQGIKVMYRF